MRIVYKKIDELIPYENNPRHNDQAVEAVAESIRQFGFRNPIIIDKDNVIVAGHTRQKAAKQLGMTEDEREVYLKKIIAGRRKHGHSQQRR